MRGHIYTIPMLLTIIRLCSPFIMPVLILCLWELPYVTPHLVLVGCFLLLSVTDIFDGYLARKFGEVTKLGQLLDPIADKFLIISSFMALFAVGAIGFAWVLILILREVFVMAVRYIACEHENVLPISRLSKVKSVLQSLFILFLLSPFGLADGIITQSVYIVLLVATLGCSLYAAYEYYMQCIDILFRTYDF